MQINSTIYNSKQKWNNKTCQCECKNYFKCRKDYNWNPSTCICKDDKYLKSIADTSVAECDEIIIFIDNVSTKKANTITTKKANATNTASINFHSKKVRNRSILHAVLLVTILLLIISIICYYYAKQKGTI